MVVVVVVAVLAMVAAWSLFLRERWNYLGYAIFCVESQNVTVKRVREVGCFTAMSYTAYIVNKQ